MKMTPILISFSYWLHALATVIFIGHFVLLATIYLPVLARAKNGTALSAISKRSRPWMYTSLLIFLVTGSYLTFVDPNYQGIGNFSNFWAVMMLVKHLIIVGMIGIGFWFNAILHVGPMMSSNNSEQAIVRFRTYVNAMAICGTFVLLLTALAQVE
jgi:Predicted integral membrane protein